MAQNYPSVASVVEFLNQHLAISQFEDYGPNGLQVDATGHPGQTPVRTLVTGVTSNLAFLEKASALKADLAVVHHGLYWGNAPSLATGPLGRRLKHCFQNQLSLAAYHLPLDAHLEIGNAAGLARAIGLSSWQPAFPYKRAPTGILGRFEAPLSWEEFQARVLRVNDRTLLFRGTLPSIQTVGIVTGGAPRLASDALALGADAFITGEASEYTQATAQEEGIHIAACGHHRSEVFGAQALVTLLSERFTDVAVQFIDVDNLA